MTPPTLRRRPRAQRVVTAAVSVLLAAGFVGVWACSPRAIATAPTPAPALLSTATAAAVTPAPAAVSAAATRREAESAALLASLRAELDAARRSAARTEASTALPVSRRIEVSSTAYCIKGLMRTGVRTRDGMAAADPSVIPLGSVVRMSHLDGEEIGTFVVMDTGGAVRGNRVDIYMDSCREASDWGRKRIVVEVLTTGRAG
ncbi:MAG TPA: 3D domain-containing protein [Longimicrobium sp.]